MRFLFITAIGLFLFAYRHLDHLTRQDPIPWYIPFIEEMSSAYVVGLTAPFIMAMARWPSPSSRPPVPTSSASPSSPSSD